MSKARLDLEKDKFDSEGRVKVSIESNNVGSFNGEVTVNNTSSEPVPVSIINPSDAIDLQVEIQPNITIDDSTPIDVNVTNSSVNTNATIQNASLDVNLTDLDVNSRLPVSVDNQPTVTIDDATPVDVNVTNTVATNATIQNTNLDVTVQNAFQYVYNMVYDGASWRFQLSDTNGKAINLDHTYYTSTEITALGSSTDINLWLAAYNDSMLQYKYVGSYDDEFEVEVYLTHPSLGDSNKCLKLIFDYSTENLKKVVKSVYASVVDWSFDDLVTGTLTVSTGTVTSPDPNLDPIVGTDVCTIGVTNTTQGTITLSLSGANASSYTIRNVTQGTTGSTIAYDSADSYVLETATTFDQTYSHLTTITATNDFYGNTDSANVATSGTITTPSFTNDEYVSGAISSANSSKRGLYNTNSFTNNKGWWPSYDQSNHFWTQTDITVSFWYKGVSNSNYICPFYQNYATADNVIMGGFQIWLGAGRIWVFRTGNNSTNGGYSYWSIGNMTAWTHLCFQMDSNASLISAIHGGQLFVNGVSKGSSTNSSTGSDPSTTSLIRCGFGAIAPQYQTTDATWATYGGSDTVYIDEISTWKQKITDTTNGLADLYNSGTPGDLSSHAASANLERWVRCGDVTGDGTSVFDENDANFELTSYDSTDRTIAY